jgi:hypothetical protein
MMGYITYFVIELPLALAGVFDTFTANDFSMYTSDQLVIKFWHRLGTDFIITNRSNLNDQLTVNQLVSLQPFKFGAQKIMTNWYRVSKSQ